MVGGASGESGCTAKESEGQQERSVSFSCDECDVCC